MLLPRRFHPFCMMAITGSKIVQVHSATIVDRVLVLIPS